MNYFKNFIIKNTSLLALLAVSLGLAPFNPEPHIWSKIKWIQGGAKGMQAMDWFDVFFHGIPFLLLVLVAIFKGMELIEKRRSSSGV
jgi:hypothetical protein